MNAAAIVFVVVTTAPPLSPAEAVKVLQSSKSILDRTHVYTTPPEARINARPTPSNERPQEFRPLGVHTVPGSTFRIPRRPR